MKLPSSILAGASALVFLSPSGMALDVSVDAVAVAIDAGEGAEPTAQSILRQLTSKSVPVVAQASLRSRSGQRCKVECGRTHKYAKEVMRMGKTTVIPGMCSFLPWGTKLEIDPRVGPDGKTIILRGRFTFHTAGPKFPTVDDVLAATREEDDVSQKVAPPAFATSRVDFNYEGLQADALELLFVDPPEGVDVGKKYAVLVRARIHSE